MNTHVHADHVTGSGVIKRRIPGVKSVIGARSGAKADQFLNHGETLTFGKTELEVRSTPGHTNGKIGILIGILK